MQKFFEILDLDMSASIEEVEQAHRELTQAWRPQSYQNLPRFKRKAEIKLKEINEAYERVRSYLLAKQAAERNGESLAVAEKLSESRKESTTTRPTGGLDFSAIGGKRQGREAPPSLRAEPDAKSRHGGIWKAQSKPDRKTPRPQFRKPHNRSLLYGFIAIAAVLGALLLYQISNHPEHRQTPLEQEKPAPQAASPQASADHPQKEPESEPAGAPVAAKTPPAVKSAEPAALAPVPMDKTKKPLKKKVAYGAALEHSVLDRINRDPDRVKRIQKSLIANGYDTGPLDGVIGPQTIAAIKQFAGDRAIKASGLFADDLTGAVLVYAEIAATHPDAPKIIRSSDFALWLDSQTHFQTSDIQKLKKSPTARQMIEILDRYKSDKKK